MNDPGGDSRVLPPSERTPLWEGVNAAADAKEFRLQRCSECAWVQYPPRELCGHCLSDGLIWEPVDPSGTVLSFTRLHASHVAFFRSGGPWPVGLVKLDYGVIVFSYLAQAVVGTGCRVTVRCRRDRSGQAVLLADSLDEDSSDAVKEFDSLFS